MMQRLWVTLEVRYGFMLTWCQWGVLRMLCYRGHKVIS